MGSLFEGKCYASNTEAADAFFSAKEPSYTAGATSYQSWYEKSVSSVWQIKRQSISSSGVVTNLTTSNATIPTFVACDQAGDFKDGAIIGWGVASALIVAACLKMLQRAK
jgi:hypothetical protein